MRKWIEKLFRRPDALVPEDIERLRVDFRDRYHSFKLLLSANNRALEVMADMEVALHGNHPFGMNFIRASCTTVSVNVFRMVRNLDLLAPGKYSNLFPRYESIQAEIEQLLALKPLIRDPRLVIPLDKVDREMADMVGPKMAHLGDLQTRMAVQIPPGFVITATAYDRFLAENDLQAEIDRRFQSATAGDLERLFALSIEIQQLIIRGELPADLKDSIADAWEALEQRQKRKMSLALRSSAIGEDVGGSAFAGQYRSELNVSRENAFAAYKQIVASKYSLPAIQYRLSRGFRDEDIHMCVGGMAMIDAVSGGVMYSRNPVDVRDDAVYIDAAWGLPKSVVDGSGTADQFVFGRKPSVHLLHREIRRKPFKYDCFPEEGCRRLDLDAQTAKRPSITNDQASSLAVLAVQLEEVCGVAQDVEWAIDAAGALFVLQSRPMQQLAPSPRETAAAAPETDVIARGGLTASPGAAEGPVHPVERNVDVLDFPQGAVLVASQALPRWASLMTRAAAVVTEEGGFAGHLANVAREFRVPALFGLTGALSKLQRGDVVTVDATGRAIHKGRVASLLGKAPEKINLMEGSPVFKTMEGVCARIVPLYLIDPDATDFRPSNCTTLHDITRFVHEKAVAEMFRFGKEHNFSERSSKQLYYKVPMQWWILNLDDGFHEETRGKYVRLENISSIPMLAFWRGFTRVPWDGPPAIDARGLMSVMFQSTTNPALTPGVRSRYADRNYFMISKNFLSLSSRLGYHFSTLEALVGRRPSENYVSFQFKGGAANLERRKKRIRFIGSILEPHEFRVEFTEDHLSARIEGRDAAFIETRLEILGYLTLHTRQIDMIMANPAQVQYYRQKIMKDIDGILTEP
jgi:pyruvate,water dikinase